jgi:hypothetical protein
MSRTATILTPRNAIVLLLTITALILAALAAANAAGSFARATGQPTLVAPSGCGNECITDPSSSDPTLLAARSNSARG